jgi:hypothetical protein
VSVDPAVQLALRVALAALFAHAALHKLRDIGAFRGALAAYRLLPPLWIVPAGAMLIAAELGVAAGLWLPGPHRAAALGAAALLTAYAAAMAVNLRRGRRDLECGCAGPAQRQPVRPALVARNALLAGAALLAALPAGTRSLTGVDALTAAGAALLLALLYTAADGLLATAPRLQRLRRRDALEVARG